MNFLERLFQADPQNPTPLHQEKKQYEEPSKHITKNIKQVNLYDT